MTAADAERLLSYVLPVVRFLGVRRVQMPCWGIHADQPAFDPAYAEPPGLRPIPEGLWGSVLSAATSLPSREAWEDLDNRFVLDVNEPAWWMEVVSQEVAAGPKHPLAPLEQPCPSDFGLSEFLKGVWYAPMGHLILADRLEDQSGPSALATALRGSETDPHPPGHHSQWISHDAFGWRWIERSVLGYVSRFCIRRQGMRPKLKTAGFVVGLLHAQDGATPRRWARWVADVEVGQRLAAEMGVRLPEDDEPSTAV